jgi:hypothetical protein
MFQEYVQNISSASDICCIQVFHALEVFKQSWGHGSGARGWGVVSRVPTVGARGAPRSCGGGCARPHPGAWVSHARRERSEVARRSHGRSDKAGMHVWDGLRRTETDYVWDETRRMEVDCVASGRVWILATPISITLFA